MSYKYRERDVEIFSGGRVVFASNVMCLKMGDAIGGNE
jgi:hypothetical protein